MIHFRSSLLIKGSNGDSLVARIVHVALTTMLMKTAATQCYVVYSNWVDPDDD